MKPKKGKKASTKNPHAHARNPGRVERLHQAHVNRKAKDAARLERIEQEVRAIATERDRLASENGLMQHQVDELLGVISRSTTPELIEQALDVCSKLEFSQEAWDKLVARGDLAPNHKVTFAKLLLARRMLQSWNADRDKQSPREDWFPHER